MPDSDKGDRFKSIPKGAFSPDPKYLYTMSVERITVTLTADMAETIKAAVSRGLYASNSEIVREALRDWRMKQLTQERSLEALHQDIAKGLGDIRQGRVKDFDAGRIVAQGEKRLNHSE